jgi:hypothetical protein
MIPVVGTRARVRRPSPADRAAGARWRYRSGATDPEPRIDLLIFGVPR